MRRLAPRRAAPDSAAPATPRSALGSALWWLAVTAGLAAGCLLELDARIACGDGTVDADVGEECDPQVPGSYERACVGTARPLGQGACDPEQCVVVATPEQCAVCGDGIVDMFAGEECDGDNLSGQVCPLGGLLRCSADCTLDREGCERCGDGLLDPGEECDPAQIVDPDDIVEPASCIGLRSPDPSRPYSSGVATACLPDCRFSRASCGYCGNGQLEAVATRLSLFDQTPIENAPPEACDGPLLDPDATSDLCEEVCGFARAGCDAACAAGCRSLEPADPAAPRCCLDAGGACPAADAPIRCCWELDHPETAPAEACEIRSTLEGPRAVCRARTDDSPLSPP